MKILRNILMKYKINDIVYARNSDKPLLVTGFLQQSDCVRLYLMNEEGEEYPYFEKNITDSKPYLFASEESEL